MLDPSDRKTWVMKKAYKISNKQARELADLACMPDDEIDLTDIPESKIGEKQ